MMKLARDKHGFVGLEAILVVVIVAAVAGTGYYVYHAKHASDKVLNAAATEAASNAPACHSKTTPATNTSDDQQLNSDLSGVNSSMNQSNQDSASSNTALNDSQSEISVPSN